jgi:hypothetical protein
MWYIRSSAGLARRLTITYRPSGDHAGDSTGICVSVDNLRGSVPSIFAIHRLSAPSRSLMNAIHWPSGETRGCAS